eukprot:3228227-Alexandrium_andersonii.AAC.1
MCIRDRSLPRPPSIRVFSFPVPPCVFISGYLLGALLATGAATRPTTPSRMSPPGEELGVTRKKQTNSFVL